MTAWDIPRFSLLFALACASCGDGASYLLVNLTSGAPLTLVAVDLTLTNAKQSGTAHFTHGASFTIPPAQSLALKLDAARSGLVDIEVSAVGTNGVLAHVTGQAMIIVGGTATISLELLPGAADFGADGQSVDARMGDQGGADLTTADASEVDSAPPDLAPPDLAPPDISEMDSSPPDMATPDLTPAPDLSMPDLLMPDLSMPDLLMPDLSMPDLLMPDLLMPDLLMPDLITPDLLMPDLQSDLLPHDA